MKINWKVRIKNPVFLASLAAAIICPILTYMGISWAEITSWGALGSLLVDAIKSPVIIVSVIVSVYNLIVDPTTAGISDSTQALTYVSPKKENNNGTKD